MQRYRDTRIQGVHLGPTLVRYVSEKKTEMSVYVSNHVCNFGQMINSVSWNH